MCFSFQKPLAWSRPCRASLRQRQSLAAILTESLTFPFSWFPSVSSDTAFPGLRFHSLPLSLKFPDPSYRCSLMSSAKHLLPRMNVSCLPLLHGPSLGSCRGLQLLCSAIYLSKSNKILFGFPSESVFKFFY